MKHIVIATVGSLGDLFPFLAVGQVLRRRGHRVTVATHAVHRDMVVQAGLAFHDASGMPEPDDREAFTARAFHQAQLIFFALAPDLPEQRQPAARFTQHNHLQHDMRAPCSVISARSY